MGAGEPRPPIAGPFRAARRAAAAVLVGSALAAGCTGDAAPTAVTADTAPATISSRPTISSPGDPAPALVTVPATVRPAPSTVPPAPATTAPAPDPTTTLTAALDALASGYQFVTTATVGGQVAVVADGDHVAGATQMTVRSGGTSTQYLVTRDAAWVQADGDWQQLASTEGLADPVGQLRSPRSVELVGTAAVATITAHYPMAVLGLRGDGERAVEFHLVDGLITSLNYASTAVVTNADGTTSERVSEVTAVFTPIAPGTQITLPAAAA